MGLIKTSYYIPFKTAIAEVNSQSVCVKLDCSGFSAAEVNWWPRLRCECGGLSEWVKEWRREGGRWGGSWSVRSCCQHVSAPWRTGPHGPAMTRLCTVMWRALSFWRTLRNQPGRDGALFYCNSPPLIHIFVFLKTLQSSAGRPPCQLHLARTRWPNKVAVLHDLPSISSYLSRCFLSTFLTSDNNEAFFKASVLPSAHWITVLVSNTLL